MNCLNDNLAHHVVPQFIILPNYPFSHYLKALSKRPSMGHFITTCGSMFYFSFEFLDVAQSGDHP
jgi:hypothetical protein